jgi:hypothetical protein
LNDELLVGHLVENLARELGEPAFAFLSRDDALAVRTVRGGAFIGIYPFDRFRRVELSGGVFHYNERFNDPGLEQQSRQFQQDQFGTQVFRNGSFAREWILENQAGRPSFLALRKQNQEHIIEQVGSELRGMMPWLKPGAGAQQAAAQQAATAAPTPAAETEPEPEPAPATGAYPAPGSPFSSQQTPVNEEGTFEQPGPTSDWGNPRQPDGQG